MAALEITLSYTGNLAEQNEIDLYDIGQALIGVQRSLALTTHLVLNDKIITQAPSLEGARILALPASEGSWKLTAQVALIATALYHLGTAPKDTVLGNLISSAYDYVISETLGFHVDYSKSLGQQYEELQKTKALTPPELSESRMDSLTEKCEVAVREMHRPISKSETATTAHLIASVGESQRVIGRPLTRETYEYMAYTTTDDSASEFEGFVSSYNMNTYKGRIYVPQFGRPVPFELSQTARDPRSILRITSSLSANAQARRAGTDGGIRFRAFRNFSRSGRLKSFYITQIV
jgi:hypothetical protein